MLLVPSFEFFIHIPMKTVNMVHQILTNANFFYGESYYHLLYAHAGDD